MARHSVDRLAAYVTQMGKVSDDEIALLAGLSRNSVGAYRRKRGIPAYTGYLFEAADRGPLHGGEGSSHGEGGGKAKTRKRGQKRAGGQRGRVSKLEPFVHLLGVRTDAEVAAIAGVARASVTMYRNRNGIPASRQGNTPAVARPAPGAAPRGRATDRIAVREPARVSAFALVARSGERSAEFVALGTDISDVVERAEAALVARADGPWRIDVLRLLGDALHAI